MLKHYQPFRGEALPFPFEDEFATRQAVIARARELINRCGERFPDWNPPPFEPRVYADALGIPLFMDHAPAQWDAIYVPVGERPKIVLNATVRSQGRRRFSLAHEIVHSWFEDSSGQTFFMRTTDRRAYQQEARMLGLERCCDAGAAELLMPRLWFERSVSELGAGAAAVLGLSNRFGVSGEAAAVRFVETRNESCAAGFFTFTVRPSARARCDTPEPSAYRARRIFRSAGFPYLFPRGKSVSESSVIYRASLSETELNAVEEFALGSNRAQVKVSARAVHRTRDGGPPTVCAVFTPSNR